MNCPDAHIIAALNRLIEVSKDGGKEFAFAAKATQAAELVALFHEGEKLCHASAAELQDQVRLLGGIAEEDGSMRGAARRRWTSVKSAVSLRPTGVLLDDCERCADRIRSRYASALQLNLPEPLRTVVRAQYRDIVVTHHRVMDLRSRCRGRDARALRSNV